MTHDRIELIEVPDGKIHWSKLMSDPDSIKWKLFTLNDETLLNFHGDKGIVFNTRVGKNINVEILGTFHKGEIDFEVKDTFLKFELDNKLSLTEPGKKYVILSIKK